MYRREFLTPQRNKDLQACFYRVLSEMNPIVLDEALTRTVNSPAKRFYISSDRAYGVLIRWEKYGITKLITAERQEMYEEIYRRILELRKSMPNTPFMHLTEMVLDQPAPKFYLETSSAKIILCKYRIKKRCLV